MQNRDLRTLRAVIRLGGFSAAADRLNMTLSAVSMQMKALEASLGAPLFDRTVRPPRPTPLGRAVAEAAVHVIDAEAKVRALAAPGALAGRFAVGIVASAGPRLLPGFLARAPAVYPLAGFAFTTGLSEALEAGVAEGTLDAAVVTATGIPPGGLAHRVLERDRLAVAGHPDLPDDAPFLHFAPGTGIGRLVAAALPAEPALAAAPRVVLDHVETIRACIVAGIGRTILPLRDLEGIGGVDVRPLDATRSLVLATRPDSALHAEAERIATLLAGPGRATGGPALQPPSSMR